MELLIYLRSTKAEYDVETSIQSVSQGLVCLSVSQGLVCLSVSQGLVCLSVSLPAAKVNGGGFI